MHNTDRREFDSNVQSHQVLELQLSLGLRELYEPTGLSYINHVAETALQALGATTSTRKPAVCTGRGTARVRHSSRCIAEVGRHTAGRTRHIIGVQYRYSGKWSFQGRLWKECRGTMRSTRCRVGRALERVMHGQGGRVAGMNGVHFPEATSGP